MTPAIPKLTGSELRARREKLCLTQAQVGQLARTSITQRKTRTGNIDQQAGTIQKWEDGTNVIPAVSAELLCAKFFLLEENLATFDHLVDTSLADILRDMWA